LSLYAAMKNSSFQHGFRYGSCQPSIELKFKLPIIANINFIDFDNWLFNFLGVKGIDEHGIIFKPNSLEPIDLDNFKVFLKIPGDISEKVAMRILLVGACCQRYANIPIFYLGKVLGKEESQSSFVNINVCVTKLSLMSTSNFALFYKNVAQFTLRLIRNYKTFIDNEIIYNDMNKILIAPLLSSVVTTVSTVPILEAAYRLGIPFNYLNHGIYQIGWGKRMRLIDRSSFQDSAIGTKISKYKKSTSEIFNLAGLPVSDHYLVFNKEDGIAIGLKMGWPLVVKPDDRDRSEGVSINISDKEGLNLAIDKALKFSKRLLIERFKPGYCYRLLIVEDKLLYALRRKPKLIVGDGKRSIAELIEIENNHSKRMPIWLRPKSILLDSLTIDTLTSQHCNLESIPKRDKEIFLKPIESSEWGGKMEDVSALVHPDNIAIALQASKLLGLSTAGVDIISEDISVAWHQNKSIINEINCIPYLGGNEISKKTLPRYISFLTDQDGRIPIEIFVGDENAFKHAEERQLELINQGQACYLTSHNITLNKDQQHLKLTNDSLFARVTALLLNSEVESIIMVIQNNELLYSGLPVDKVTSMSIIPHTSIKQGEDETEKNHLVDLIKSYLK
jgi:cyanophycin synthetase